VVLLHHLERHPEADAEDDDAHLGGFEPTGDPEWDEYVKRFRL
jgi:hypothetical protein